MYVCLCVVYRLGLMLTVCVDVLLWFSGVTDDSVHMKIELENQDKYNRTFNSTSLKQTEPGSLLCMMRIIMF